MLMVGAKVESHLFLLLRGGLVQRMSVFRHLPSLFMLGPFLHVLGARVDHWLAAFGQKNYFSLRVLSLSRGISLY